MGCGCNKRKSVPQQRKYETKTQVKSEFRVEATTVTSTSEESAPVVKDKSYNILDVIQDKITGNIKYVDRETLNKRFSLCKSCEHLKIGLCMQCGCIVEFKTRYVESTCPVGKW